MMYSFHLKFSSTDPLKRWSFIYIPLVAPSWWVSWWGPITIFGPKFCSGALFGPNEVLETHLAPFLNQISALEQKKFAGREGNKKDRFFGESLDIPINGNQNIPAVNYGFPMCYTNWTKYTVCDTVKGFYACIY